MNNNQKFIVEVRKALLEADASWLEIQPAVVRSILHNPQVQVIGYNLHNRWSSLDEDAQVNLLFSYFNNKGTLKAARAYMVNSPDIKRSELSQNYFDVLEIEEPHNGIKPKHAEQMKNSKMFKDLQQLFLKDV